MLCGPYSISMCLFIFKWYAFFNSLKITYFPQEKNQNGCYLASWLDCPLQNICVTNDEGYVPFNVNTIPSFPHPCLITVLVPRITRRSQILVQYIKLWVWTPFMARCTLYNIVWSILSVTWDRPVVFSWYSSFLNQENWPPRYN
jgi:hypothetical protein